MGTLLIFVFDFVCARTKDLWCFYGFPLIYVGFLTWVFIAMHAERAVFVPQHLRF